MTDTRLIVVVGPTASGKSSLATALAADVGGELVSADSVQVYRGLDIGSAKPSKATQAQVRHHLIDVLDPHEQSDAAWWAAGADAAIRDIRARGARPIVVGGTGLYIRALLRGLAPTPPVDPAVRASLTAELSAIGHEAMHARLHDLDPVTAARLAPADAQRVLRALSVQASSGRPLSAWHADDRPAEPRYPIHLFELDAPREWLDPRIETRARAMVRDGMVEETTRMLASGVRPEAPGLQTLGYRAVVRSVIAGTPPDLDTLAEEIAAGHRKYAKRQRTWLRGIGRRHVNGDQRFTLIAVDDNPRSVAQRALRLN